MRACGDTAAPLVGMLEPHQLLPWGVGGTLVHFKFCDLCITLFPGFVLFFSYLWDKTFQVSLRIVQFITRYASPIHICFCFSFKIGNQQPTTHLLICSREIGMFHCYNFPGFFPMLKNNVSCFWSTVNPYCFCFGCPVGAMTWEITPESGSWESQEWKLPMG